MVEATTGTQGDAVSRLLQLEAKLLRVGLKWTGKGHDDIRLTLSELDNARTVKDALFLGIEELLRMPEANALPEAMQAKLAAIVLHARALLDLRVEARNRILQQQQQPAPRS